MPKQKQYFLLGFKSGEDRLLFLRFFYSYRISCISPINEETSCCPHLCGKRQYILLPVLWAQQQASVHTQQYMGERGTRWLKGRKSQLQRSIAAPGNWNYSIASPESSQQCFVIYDRSCFLCALKRCHLNFQSVLICPLTPCSGQDSTRAEIKEKTSP
jgi:hypothetical protein